MNEKRLARKIWRVLIVLVSLALSAPAVAQVPEQASIVGRVTDESGAVLPGVTVAVTGPALQVPQMMAVTDEHGEFRITPLPMGTFVVTYTLNGFRTIRREDIRLTAGFVAKLDEVMKLGAVEETITVSGQSPVVDVRSTGTGTQLTRETLDLIPSTRNGLHSILAQAPGARGTIDVGGSSFRENNGFPTFLAYGQDGEQWNTLEGVMTRSMSGLSSTGQAWDYSSFDETKVTAIGKDIEVASRGLQINAVAKSGSNDFHGQLFYGLSGPKLQANNINAELSKVLPGTQTLITRSDLSGELGGRIVLNKLWFYGSARTRYNEENILGNFKEDGTPGVFTVRQTFYTGKVSYQLNPRNRLIGFYQYTPIEVSGGQASSTQLWEARRFEHRTYPTRKIEWQGVMGSNLVMSLQYGDWYGLQTYDGATDKPAWTDQVTLIVGGNNTFSSNVYRNRRLHTTGKLTYHKSTSSTGTHSLRAGFDQFTERWNVASLVRPSGDYRLIFASGVPFQIQTYNNPTDPTQLGRFLAMYAADNWTIARRLTLNLGLRFSHEHDFVPAQCHAAGTFAAAKCFDLVDTYATWNGAQPRLSAALDVTGNGKTVLKGGWHRFDSQRSLEQVGQGNFNASITTTYLWHDTGNKDYDPGEVNLNLGPPDFVSISGNGVAAQTIPDPQGIQPKQDQVYASLERELIPNMAVRVTGAFVRAFNVPRLVYVNRPMSAYNVAVTRPDPGPDGRAGTADDPGTNFTYFEYPTTFVGGDFETTMQTTPSGEPNQTFKTIELAALKRLSNGWQLMTSFSATKKNIPIPTTGQAVPFKTPNDEFNTADNTWDWLYRATGSYAFPLGLNASAAFESRSGVATARNVRFTGGRTIPAQVLNVEPIGSLRLPTLNVLDLRVEKVFRLSKNQKFAARVNAYNALNVDTVTGLTTRAGATYLVPTRVLPARIVEVSGNFTF